MAFALLEKVKPWLAATRPRTLPAALAPVAVGSAAAYAAGSFVMQAALICFAFALLMQITTNYANDYFDHVNGVDTAERIGPTRAVASGQIAPRTMLVATIAVALLGIAVGLFLLRYGGWWLLGVGILSAICAIAYTGGPYPLGYNGLGDVFVLIFFGPVAVGCTYYVQVGAVSAAALLAGLGVGLMVTNILVINNYRDFYTDAKTGKRTLVVRFGRPFGLWQYGVGFALAMAVPLLLWLCLGAGAGVLLTWLVLPLGVRLLCLLLHTQEGAVFNRMLGQTAMLAMVYALLLSVGWLLG